MATGSRWRRLFDAFREMRASDGDVHAGIRFFDAMTAILGRGEAKMIRLMASTEHGRKTLASGDSLLPALTDRDRLRSLPDGTLGREYIRFADEREIYPEQFEALLMDALGRSRIDSELDDPEAQLVIQRYRHLHDVWHVVLGYDTDPDGEMGILACAGRQNGYRAHYLSAFVQALRPVFGGDTHRLRVFLAGWRRAKRIGTLISRDWVALLEEPLDRVRQELHVGVA